MGLNPIGQSCLTGLLAHCYYGVYDVNGPRYLWWTWHDGDPAISERQKNAPLGSSLWILTYCGLQSLLSSWLAGGRERSALYLDGWKGSDMSLAAAIGPLLAKLSSG